MADALRAEYNKRQLGEWKEKLIKVAEIGDKTEPQVSLSRYPGLTNDTLWLPYEEYDIDIAKEYLQNAEIVFKIIDKKKLQIVLEAAENLSECYKDDVAYFLKRLKEE